MVVAFRRLNTITMRGLGKSLKNTALFFPYFARDLFRYKRAMSASWYDFSVRL
jgi:hypothetical protein